MNYTLDSLEQIDTHRVDIGKNDDATSVGFIVRGVGSDEYIAAERVIQIMNIKEAALRKVSLDLTTDEGAGVVADGAAVRKRVLAEHCVIDWYGFRQADNTPAEFSIEAALRVLKRRPTWLDKITAALEDESVFTKG